MKKILAGKSANLRGTTMLSRRGFLKVGAAPIAAATLASSIPFLRPSPARGATRNYQLVVENNGASQMTYNGQSPGPTISANPGDTIDIEFINMMPASSTNNDCPSSMNSFHGLRTTNLHTHGLHVSPNTDSSGQFDADNIFLRIVPFNQNVGNCWNDANFREGKTKYRFELPADHPPGTYWYHAHKHGSTHHQVSAGLAGPLIVNDPAGLMPPYIANAPQKIIMFTASGVIIIDQATGDRSSPAIELAPGAVERWRIINANPSANSFLNINSTSKDLELFQIAFDGLTLPKRIQLELNDAKDPWINPAALAPGNRMDLIVRVKNTATPESVVAFARPFDSAILPQLQEDEVALDASQQTVEVKVTGGPIQADWSEENDLPGPGLAPISGPIAQTREVAFGPGFTIAGDKYVPEPLWPDKPMKLNTNEVWKVSNTMGRPHPFHIHVNPFFVTHINDEQLEENDPLRRWQDTISLPPNGSVTFQTQYADFTGKFVIHCHILAHEDLGMMRAVEIVP